MHANRVRAKMRQGRLAIGTYVGLADPAVVEVIGLDSRRSSLRTGILARVRKGGREHSVGLADLHFVDPDPTSAEWLAMYRYWAGMNEGE